MTKKIIFTLVVILLLLDFVACKSYWRPPIPDSDIVFNIFTDDQHQFGFVDEDGSDNVTLDLNTRGVAPVWIPSNRSIAFIKLRATPESGGYLQYWEDGKPVHTCKDLWNVVSMGGFNIDNEEIYVLISQISNPQVVTVDINSCQIIDQFIDLPDVRVGGIIKGISLAPDNTSFLYAEADDPYGQHPVYTLKKMDIVTREVTSLVEGINPAWSPDGQKIVFVRLDGIYLINQDGSNLNQLVAIDNTEIYDKLQYDLLSPTPQWSPDSKWIVYHKCLSSCISILDYGIVKIEVATGLESVIISGGAVFPSWRSR